MQVDPSIVGTIFDPNLNDQKNLKNERDRAARQNAERRAAYASAKKAWVDSETITRDRQGPSAVRPFTFGGLFPGDPGTISNEIYDETVDDNFKSTWVKADTVPTLPPQQQSVNTPLAGNPGPDPMATMIALQKQAIAAMGILKQSIDALSVKIDASK